MPGGLGDLETAEAREALDYQEKVAEAARFRVVLAIAMPLWVLSGVLDWVTATWAVPQPVSSLWLLRAMPLVPGFFAYLRLRAPTPPGPRMLQLISFSCFVVPAAALSLMALHYWGIASPYGHGVLCVIVAYSTAMPRSWRASWPFYLALLAVFPLTMALGALVEPEVRAQLAAPEERMQLLQLMLAATVAVALSLLAGHLHARLRREVLASRQRSRYQLVRKLGAGGMGEVWRARHPGLRREVALKILRESGNAEAVARFAREIKATRALSHPNTVRILDCGVTDEDLWYYSMELLEGQTLAQVVGASGPMRPARAVYLTLQAARALAEAHREGILHRDIKPENLFVTSRGGEHDVIKVLDFGIAGLVRSNQHLTREGTLVGTLRWMSPEQELGLAADARSDVYGLGAVLYFMLTARPPVDGVSLMALIRAREHRGIAPASSINPAVSPALDALVARCLHKAPGERFADAGELARALRDLNLHQTHVGQPLPPPPAELDAQHTPTLASQPSS